ncbi:hypothetical protein [Nesterenkonia xinjiangensis]|uniref:Uncharacterized protein n=1 Tax=Nesterenkonia xinjiangensis TaxID=225327 RepID=A0A7Z0K9X4_9MICC|nr:hypothetical protein [Nesterenkonia xinjiangensis]NYJ78228.1 hypothetical protein [Nesterenkonia xinjiangensis]
MNRLTRLLRFCEEVALAVDSANAVRHGLPLSDRAVRLQHRRGRTRPGVLPESREGGRGPDSATGGAR